jgi:hypothetical protein
VYCSRACQQQAYRHRHAQRDAHRIPPGDERQLVQEYADVPSRQLGDSLALAAGRIAGALTAGQPVDDHDLGILARVPVVLAGRAHDRTAAAHALHGIPADQPAPTVTVVDLALTRDRPAPPHAQTSRDDQQPAAAPTATATTAAAPPPARRRHATKTSRDDSAPATASEPAAKGGIEPRPQKLPKKKAAAIVEAAELVRDPEHRDNHRWVLRSGDTVLGYIEPSYGGVSRSGRNGWLGRLAGIPGRRGRTRYLAATDLAMRWVRLVTATPKRTITGSN